MNRLSAIKIVFLLVIGVMTGVFATASLMSRANVEPAKPPAAPTQEAHKDIANAKIVLGKEAIANAQIRVLAVAPSEVEQTIPVPGVVKVNPDRQANITSPVPGRIVRSYVNVGQAVNVGAPLLDIDSVELLHARNDLQTHAAALRRMERLYKEELVSQTEIEGTRLQYQQDAAKIAQVERGGGSIKAGTGLLTLTAPLAGNVTERRATRGDSVDPNSPLVKIENLNTVLVQAYVPESAIARVREGLPARVSVPAYPQKRFSGSLASIGGHLDEKTRTLTVFVLVKNEGRLLKPEMFAAVSLVTGREKAMMLPLAAVSQEGEERFVFIESDGGFVRRSVQVEQIDGENVRLISGIAPGEKVVVNGAFILKSEARKAELKEGD